VRTDATLGPRIRALRRHQHFSQAELARRLGISPSYLNLIEHNRRPCPAELLIKLAELVPIDLKLMSAANDGRTADDLLEVFGDALFENLEVLTDDVRDMAAAYPSAAQAVLRLYHAYRTSQESLQTLASRVLSDGNEVAGVQTGSRLPTEEVSDLIQRHLNYFPELEQGAETLTRDARLESTSLFTGLADYLQRVKHVEVRIEQAGQMQSALRRFDPDTRVLTLSEVLRRGSRNFQLAHQAGLITQSDVLDRIAGDPLLTTDESRALCRVALANYFASAVLMPYEPFLSAARAERYDIELLGHRFRASFEQTCHRLTTLRRPGMEGIPFHMLRTDIAGNISKRFSASGLRFARFSGACPRWNVFEAFQTPGRIRTQLSEFPDGRVYFEIAFAASKNGGGYRSPNAQYGIALGCPVSYAGEMVYADGLDLTSREAAIEVGPTCRLCDRMNCEQRAYPPLQHALAVNEHVRGVSFYAPVRD
jgi:predicted transcriptional regulator/DNA-binding XRE family transcriptional regulator